MPERRSSVLLPASPMKTNSTSQSAFINLRLLLAVTLGFLGVALAIVAGRGGALSRKLSGDAPAARADQAAHYMPVPGDDSKSETKGLTQLEEYWFDRLTFPTGRFNPAWVRAAAAQHDRMPSGVPAGSHSKLNKFNPNLLSTTSFTALGPQPEQ